MPRTQTNTNKIGEIEFRRKLAEQFKGEKTVFPFEPNTSEFSSILKSRIKDYTKYFTRLQEKKIPFNLYLEIGGGVGQAAMLIENNFNASGFTSDISFETLVIADKYKKELLLKKMPIRIACDVYNLPFRNRSIPFIFTFQTLHHFPDPHPILREINRVLTPGGYLYFHEEPISQTMNLNLWRRGHHLSHFEKILKLFLILHFVSKIGKSEVEHNILEETFSIDMWEKALNIFPKVDANLIIFPVGFSITRKKRNNKNWLKPSLPKRILLAFMGGGIEALCQKAGKINNIYTNSPFEHLGCPQCKHKPKLHYEKNKEILSCNICKTSFPKVKGVYFLFSKKQQKLLYPHL